jgi:hypothetical protein
MWLGALVTVVLGTTVPAVAAGGPTVCASTFEEPFTGEAEALVVPAGGLCVLEGAEITGGVVAQPGAELQIGPGTTIGGSVDAYDDTATAMFEATVGGSYRCHDCIFEDVVFSSVGKNVEIRGTDDGDFIFFSSIGGNVVIKDSTAGAFAFVVQGNEIAGSVELAGNDGPVGVEDNSIGGHLRFVGNEILESVCGENCPPFANGNIARNTVRYGIDVFGNTGLPLSITANSAGGDLNCTQNDPAPSGADNTAKRKRGQCRTF